MSSGRGWKTACVYDKFALLKLFLLFLNKNNKTLKNRYIYRLRFFYVNFLGILPGASQ